MNINDNTDTVSDLDIRIAAAHESPDFAREVDEFEDAKRNALADEPEPVITVRAAPEYRDVDDHKTDALGQIDPADANAFTAFQVGRLTRPFKVDSEGRVFAPFYVCGGEAEWLGQLIAEFNAAQLTIDPAHCPTGAGKLWCPRCGFGCCSVSKDPNDRDRLVCSGGCDAHGHHHETNVA